MKAAVLHAPQQRMTIENVSIEKPKRREVLVRTAAAGLCHSDLHFIEGSYPTPVPAVLGHESAGIVEAVGEDVTYLKPGDHVISCLSMFCGHFRRWALPGDGLTVGSAQIDRWPDRQNSQWPQNIDRQLMTWSPGLR